MIPRRTFLRGTLGSGALAALGDLGFLAKLPPVSAQETLVEPAAVQLDAGIEPLVRLLENTPRDRVLEEVAARVQRGLSYRELLAALLLAGVRNIQPRPVGFKFHAVLVIHSAHLASQSSADGDRWLPIFWAINQFKSSQESDVREGNWTMVPVAENRVPPAARARAAFIEAMDRWDESAADVAVAGFARTASADELFEVFCRYGVRDFRDIGHKAIYVANSFRCLEVIGWQHAEPVLRSLAYALLDRSGARENPADADLLADRPFRQSLEALRQLRETWLEGKPSADATAEILQAARGGAPADLSALAVTQLNSGIAPASIFAGLFNGAAEFLMRSPGILSLHAMTFTNAAHYAWHRVRSDETRRLLLLQNASFLPLFRGGRDENELRIDALEPLPLEQPAEQPVAEIFDEASRDRTRAARKALAYLQGASQANDFAAAARRLIFLKGRDSHDFKFSAAVLEDYARLSSPWRERMLAASLFYLRHPGEPDNDLVKRTRAALSA